MARLMKAINFVYNAYHTHYISTVATTTMTACLLLHILRDTERLKREHQSFDCDLDMASALYVWATPYCMVCVAYHEQVTESACMVNMPFESLVV